MTDERNDPDAKMSTRIRNMLGAGSPRVSVNVTLRDDVSPEVKHSIVETIGSLARLPAARQGAAPARYRSAFGILSLEVPREKLREIAALDGVQWIDVDATAPIEELKD